VTKNALPVTLPVIASEMTDARIGPTQGVQSNPRLMPMNIPPVKPVFWLWPLGAKRWKK